MTDDLLRRAMDPDSPALLPDERRKLFRKPTPKKGHAAAPGSGPEGETCGTCRNLFRNRMAKTYLKCGLMRNFWTGGAGTDIRARDAACSQWAAKEEG